MTPQDFGAALARAACTGSPREREDVLLLRRLLDNVAREGAESDDVRDFALGALAPLNDVNADALNHSPSITADDFVTLFVRGVLIYFPDDDTIDSKLCDAINAFAEGGLASDSPLSDFADAVIADDEGCLPYLWREGARMRAQEQGAPYDPDPITRARRSVHPGYDPL